MLFYDMTSSYFTSDRSVADDDLRRHGYSRDFCPWRYQITIGLVMTGGGLPLCHYVFPGNTQDRGTIERVVVDVKRRFGVREVVIVGDRGMLSADNLDLITDEELQFIISYLPGADRSVAEEQYGR